jgi:hypothetical protein
MPDPEDTHRSGITLPPPERAKWSMPSKMRIAVGWSMARTSARASSSHPVRRHLPSIGGHVFWLEPELGENLFHGNAFAAALCEPGLAVADAAAVLFGHRLVIRRRVGNRVGRRIKHGFEQTANGGNLGASRSRSS